MEVHLQCIDFINFVKEKAGMILYKNFKLLFILIIAAIIFVLQSSFLSEEKVPQYSEAGLEKYLCDVILDFKNDVTSLRSIAIEKENPSVKKLRQQFLKCRLKYKKLEYFAGYYFSHSERDLNGPTLPEIEEDIDSRYVRPPHGLQVIESILYADSLDKKELLIEIDLLVKLSISLSYTFKTLNPYEYQLFDVMQMRLVKLYALGVNNFDCQLSKTGLAETSASLKAMKDIFLASYGVSSCKIFIPTFDRIDKACAFLNVNTKNASFDFFIFYKDYILPLNKELILLRAKVVKSNPQRMQALNLRIPTLFEPDAYNSHYFTRLQKENTNVAMVNLGKILFFDPLLSRNNKVSCASCHKPQLGYTDGIAKANGFLKADTLPRNTPTLLNAALQRNLFMDSRAFALEDQAKAVVQNEREMHGDFDEVVVKLKQSTPYRKMFAEAFAASKDSSITEHGIVTALAEFQRTLISLNSRFDKSIRGEENSLIDDEIEGYNLFMGKAKCAHCHFTGLFNGTSPPAYKENEFDIIGVPSTDQPPYELDKDEGRYPIFKTEELKFAFKTTTVRNAGITAPYMHNGVFKTLEQVVDFYNEGGGVGLGVLIPTQTLPADKLNLTLDEQKKIILFIKSLTDTSNVVYFKGDLPAIDDSASVLNKRIAGGGY